MIQHCKYGLRQGLQFFKESWRPRWTWNHERTLSELWVNCESELWEWTLRVNQVAIFLFQRSAKWTPPSPINFPKNSSFRTFLGDLVGSILGARWNRKNARIRNKLWENLERTIIDMSRHESWLWTDCWKHLESQPLAVAGLLNFTCHNWFAYTELNPLTSLDMWNQFELHLCHNSFVYSAVYKPTEELGHVKPVWTSLVTNLSTELNPLNSSDMWNQFKLHLSQFICILS